MSSLPIFPTKPWSGSLNASVAAVTMPRPTASPGWPNITVPPSRNTTRAPISLVSPGEATPAFTVRTYPASTSAETISRVRPTSRPG
jgi:hypothetical protein